MSTAGIRAGKAYVEIYGNKTPLAKTLDSIPRDVAKAGKGISAAGVAAGGIAAALITKAANATFSFGASALQAGGDLQDMADRTGIAVEAIAELDQVAKRSGTSFETLEGGIRKMQVNLADAASGSKEARKKFADLGVDVEKLSKLSPDKQFEAMADAIAKIDNPAARSAAAMDIFGKSGVALLPVLKDGAAGIQGFRTEARSLGRLSTDQVQTLDKLGDTFENMGTAITNAASSILADLAPNLELLADTVSAIAGRISQGDLTGAFDIVVATIDVAWQELLMTLGVDWVEAWAGIRTTFNDVSNELFKGVLDWSVSLEQATNDAWAGMTNGLLDFQSQVTRVVIDLKRLYGQITEEQYNMAQKFRESATAIAKESNTIGAQKKNEQARKNADMLTAGSDAATELANKKALRDAEQNSAAKKLEDAKARLEALNKAAAEKTAAASGAAGGIGAVANVGIKAAAFTGGNITFGGTAAGLTANQGPMGEVVESTKETAENTRKLLDKGGLAFVD